MSPRGDGGGRRGPGGSGGGRRPGGRDDGGRGGGRGGAGGRGRDGGSRGGGAGGRGRDGGGRGGPTGRDGGGRGRDAAGPPGGGRGRPGDRDRGRSGERRPEGGRPDRARDGEDRDRHDAPQVLYGRNPVREAARAGRRRLTQAWATDAALRGEPWLQDLGVPVRRTETEDLTERAGTEDHQGVVAKAGPYPYVELEELLAGTDPFLLALDEVQDPRNLGALARTAEAAGLDGLVLCERRAASVTPVAAKASAGAVEHLRIARVPNLADALLEARRRECWIYGAAAGAKSLRYDRPDYRGGLVLVMGGEGSGIRTRVAKACDALIELPLRGRIESLNVSAAGAALVYGILQRRDHLDSET